MKKTGRRILLVIIVFVIIGGVKIYHLFTTPDYFEVLLGLLEEPQNERLNTTGEKTGFTPYQILDGNLYYEKDSLYQYNYNSKQRKKLWDGEVMGFKIMKDKVFYAEWQKNRNEYDHNFWNIECRDLGDLHKEQVAEGVSDWVFSGESVFFSRMERNIRRIWQYDINSRQCKEIVAFNIFDQNEESEQGEME